MILVKNNKSDNYSINIITVFKKIFVLILLVVILLGSPILARSITNLFDFSTIDPDGVFMWLSIRHVLQALIVLVLIGIITKFFPVKFNLGLGNTKIGLRYLKRFVGIFFVYTMIAFLIILLFGQFEVFPYPMNVRNISGYLAFQLFLSGPSEELIFRAFAITIFSTFIINKRINHRLSYANLFGMLIFGIAHVSISLSPISFEYSIPQILLSVGLGYFYGDCYEKSKSVIYPMIMHSYTNVLMVGIAILLSIII